MIFVQVAFGVRFLPLAFTCATGPSAEGGCTDRRPDCHESSCSLAGTQTTPASRPIGFQQDGRTPPGRSRGADRVSPGSPAREPPEPAASGKRRSLSRRARPTMAPTVQARASHRLPASLIPRNPPTRGPADPLTWNFREAVLAILWTRLCACVKFPRKAVCARPRPSFLGNAAFGASACWAGLSVWRCGPGRAVAVRAGEP